MEPRLRSGARLLQRRYQRTLLLAALLLIAALLAYSGLQLSDRQQAILADAKSEGRQLKLSLEDTIDVVRAHLFVMRRSVESGLTRPQRAEVNAAPSPQGRPSEISGESVAKSLQPEIGSLLVDPNATFDLKTVRRDLAAAASFLPEAAATHQWNHVFQWSYFYDSAERWMLIFPQFPPDEVYRTTKTRDMSAALRVLLDADGTRPLAMVGTRNNAKREMLWTPPYLDAAGKGMMVTLLAPVYLADAYVGAVGTDVTLKELNLALREHAPGIGRAVVVDPAGNLLADNGGALDKAEGRIQLSGVFPDLSNGVASIAPENPAWLRYPLKGTEWTLLLNIPREQLRRAAVAALIPYLSIALLMFVAIFALAWLRDRRYAWPALTLADYVERSGAEEGAQLPDVPEIWTPIFEQVATTTRERRELLRRVQEHADELEGKVAERTAELEAANASLRDTVLSLQQTRADLVRADRMGSLGGMIAGVANELQGPLAKAAQTAQRFQAGIDAFKVQQSRGLRKAELEAFVAEADTVGRQVSREIVDAVGLLGRFKQLALDQSSDQKRPFSLHEVVENVLAAMRPALALHGSSVDNRVDPNIEMVAQAGKLGQILHHLLADAIERVATIGSSGRIEFMAGLDSDAQGEHVLLTLRDNGTPPAATQAGQSIAATLAQELEGGNVDIHLSNEGSRVTLRVPKSMG